VTLLHDSIGAHVVCDAGGCTASLTVQPRRDAPPREAFGDAAMAAAERGWRAGSAWWSDLCPRCAIDARDKEDEL
jgi:hypothetical protein